MRLPCPQQPASQVARRSWFQFLSTISQLSTIKSPYQMIAMMELRPIRKTSTEVEAAKAPRNYVVEGGAAPC